MFNKKKCKNCNKSVSNNYSFCPYCRNPIKDAGKKEDWGLLGKDDSMVQDGLDMPFGIAGFANLFNSLVNNLSKQLNGMDNLEKKGKDTSKKRGIGISISTSGNNPPEIKFTSFGDGLKPKKNIEKIKPVELNIVNSNSKRFEGLSKKEPETNIRRLSNKIVYEMFLPEVKSLDDVSIIQLENSIEIKALGKKCVFYKVIPIKLPIKKYNLLKEKLVLEFDA